MWLMSDDDNFPPAPKREIFVMLLVAVTFAAICIVGMFAAWGELGVWE